MGTPRLLIVEDELILARNTEFILSTGGYTVLAIVRTGKGAIEQAKALQPDLILMDIKLKGVMDGIEAGQWIHRHLHIPIVYLTAHSDTGTIQRIKKSYAFGYVLKPFEEPMLLMSIAMALQHAATETQLYTHNASYHAYKEMVNLGMITTTINGSVVDYNAYSKLLFDIENCATDNLSSIDFYANPFHREEFLKLLKSQHIMQDYLLHLKNPNGTMKKYKVASRLSTECDRRRDLIFTILEPVNENNTKKDAMLLKLLENIPHSGVQLVNNQGIIEFWNKKSSEFFGYSASEIIGEKITTLFKNLPQDIITSLSSISPIDRPSYAFSTHRCSRILNWRSIPIIRNDSSRCYVWIEWIPETFSSYMQ